MNWIIMLLFEGYCQDKRMGHHALCEKLLKLLGLPGPLPSCRPPVIGGWSEQRGSSPGPRTRWWSCQGWAGGAGVGVTSPDGGPGDIWVGRLATHLGLVIIRGRLCFAPSHWHGKASHGQIDLKRDKIGFCVNLSHYGATRTQPNNQCLHLRPMLWFISFIEWLSGAAHHPLTSYIVLIWFQFRNWQNSRNFSVWVSKSNLMMVSQITIMCMKSGQGETLRYES